ncbi:hypothetical protein [Flavobacterium terrisoli]|uniref:hypothetical protein n=1 Tax=Flavobacterium terrisoli TaxID=3242195 RepID=UPI0025426D08|nr:hypothetical protein [Flavobacterium buctense]
MKKAITILCAIVLAFSFNSCSSDDSSGGASSSDNIVGSWKYVGDMYVGVFEPYEAEPCDDEILKFSGNNTGKYIIKYCGESSEVTSFAWERTSDPIYNYTTTDNETGETIPGIVIFSEDYQSFTTYDTQEDMLNQDNGTVFEKQ